MPAVSAPAAIGAQAKTEQRSLRSLLERAQPQYVALAGILALAAVLNTHRLSQNGYANTFYSAGVHSMLKSWHNFFFVSFDAGGLVTIDKPPLALWVQAASAELFGFSPLSLLLPEAIISVIAVAVLYRIVARRLGAGAGLAGGAGACRVPFLRGCLARERRRPAAAPADDPGLRGGLERDRRRALALADGQRAARRAGLQHQDARRLSGRAGDRACLLGVRAWALVSADRDAGGRGSGDGDRVVCVDRRRSN